MTYLQRRWDGPYGLNAGGGSGKQPPNPHIFECNTRVSVEVCSPIRFEGVVGFERRRAFDSPTVKRG